jgi:uncharacterized membrane protein
MPESSSNEAERSIPVPQEEEGEPAKPGSSSRGTHQEPPLKPEITDSEKPQSIRRELIVSASYYEGVLPPPEYFERLERIVPGSSQLILESYLKQATHRQNNENKVIAANIAARTLGMKLGAWLASLGIIGGCVVAAFGYPAAGGSIAGATALALATSYLKALADQRKDLLTKFREMKDLAKKKSARSEANAGDAPPK